MKQLFYKLLYVPFASFLTTLVTVATMQTFLGQRWMKEHLDNSALPVWLGWIVLLVVIIIVHHFMKNRNQK